MHGVCNMILDCGWRNVPPWINYPDMKWSSCLADSIRAPGTTRARAVPPWTVRCWTGCWSRSMTSRRLNREGSREMDDHSHWRHGNWVLRNFQYSVMIFEQVVSKIRIAIFIHNSDTIQVDSIFTAFIFIHCTWYSVTIQVCGIFTLVFEVVRLILVCGNANPSCKGCASVLHWLSRSPRKQ